MVFTPLLVSFVAVNFDFYSLILTLFDGEESRNSFREI